MTWQKTYVPTWRKFLVSQCARKFSKVRAKKKLVKWNEVISTFKYICIFHFLKVIVNFWFQWYIDLFILSSLFCHGQFKIFWLTVWYDMYFFDCSTVNWKNSAMINTMNGRKFKQHWFFPWWPADVQLKKVFWETESELALNKKLKMNWNFQFFI